VEVEAFLVGCGPELWWWKWMCEKHPPQSVLILGILGNDRIAAYDRYLFLSTGRLDHTHSVACIACSFCHKRNTLAGFVGLTISTHVSV